MDEKESKEYLVLFFLALLALIAAIMIFIVMELGFFNILKYAALTSLGLGLFFWLLSGIGAVHETANDETGLTSMDVMGLLFVFPAACILLIYGIFFAVQWVYEWGFWNWDTLYAFAQIIKWMIIFTLIGGGIWTTVSVINVLCKRISRFHKHN